VSPNRSPDESSSTEGELREVGVVTDFDSTDRIQTTVDGKPISVIQFDDEYFAVENVCAHDGGPVGTGRVQGSLEGEWPGSGEHLECSYSDEPAIACPWHGYEYDLETGNLLADDEISLETFDVVVQEDTICLYL